MKKKKGILILMMMVLIFADMLTVQAEQTLTEDGSVNVPLTALIESRYSVSIPASLTLTAGTAEADGTPFTGTMNVGVKGNINPGKAVVVVPSDGQLEGGSLTAESISQGNEIVNSVTTEMLNGITGKYETSVTVKGAADPTLTNTIRTQMDYIRWANAGVTETANCETHLNASTYTNSSVSLAVKLTTADTYQGNLQFTFKLVDRR